MRITVGMSFILWCHQCCNFLNVFFVYFVMNLSKILCNIYSKHFITVAIWWHYNYKNTVVFMCTMQTNVIPLNTEFLIHASEHYHDCDFSFPIHWISLKICLIKCQMSQICHDMVELTLLGLRYFVFWIES